MLLLLLSFFVCFLRFHFPRLLIACGIIINKNVFNSMLANAEKEMLILSIEP